MKYLFRPMLLLIGVALAAISFTDPAWATKPAHKGAAERASPSASPDKNFGDLRCQGEYDNVLPREVKLNPVMHVGETAGITKVKFDWSEKNKKGWIERDQNGHEIKTVSSIPPQSQLEHSLKGVKIWTSGTPSGYAYYLSFGSNPAYSHITVTCADSDVTCATAVVTAKTDYLSKRSLWDKAGDIAHRRKPTVEPEKANGEIVVAKGCNPQMDPKSEDYALCQSHRYRLQQLTEALGLALNPLQGGKKKVVERFPPVEKNALSCLAYWSKLIEKGTPGDDRTLGEKAEEWAGVKNDPAYHYLKDHPSAAVSFLPGVGPVGWAAPIGQDLNKKFGDVNKGLSHGR